MAAKQKLYVVQVNAVLEGGKMAQEDLLVRAKTKAGALSIAAKERLLVREPSQDELLKLGKAEKKPLEVV
jgi:hypothetical protein